jgi:hypothetical protein
MLIFIWIVFILTCFAISSGSIKRQTSHSLKYEKLKILLHSLIYKHKLLGLKDKVIKVRGPMIACQAEWEVNGKIREIV